MRERWRTPAGRGFLMLAVMSAAFGFASSAHTAIQTNDFNDGLTLPAPFLVAWAFALAASMVTLRLDPAGQRCTVSGESGKKETPPRPEAEA